jgi:hypothetical protein
MTFSLYQPSARERTCISRSLPPAQAHGSAIRIVLSKHTAIVLGTTIYSSFFEGWWGGGARAMRESPGSRARRCVSRGRWRQQASQLGHVVALEDRLSSLAAKRDRMDQELVEQPELCQGLRVSHGSESSRRVILQKTMLPGVQNVPAGRRAQPYLPTYFPHSSTTARR